ncbi:MAG: tRNA lysidine(34) synthetase TilS [Thermoanaerobaculia bacterium]
MKLLATLERAFCTEFPLAVHDLLLVAFSGGADSTALLWGLRELSQAKGFQMHAAHLDHALDRGSPERAAAADRLAADLAVPIASTRIPVSQEKRPGESTEQAARRIRYRYLEEVRRELAARYVVTAHHADDQLETVVLRMLFGSGLEGLSGIASRHGKVVRPLLALRRREVRQALERGHLQPVEDPTNQDLRIPRNRIRNLVLPRLLADDPLFERRILRLAAAASGARRSLENTLKDRLQIRRDRQGVAVRRKVLADLPQELWPSALSLLHREAGASYPPGRPARRDLLRQCRDGGRIGCDCGDGWRWSSSGEDLRLERRRSSTPLFSYTLEVPGEVEIPELAVRVRVRYGKVADWMFQGSPGRAGLALPLAPGDRVTVRNRRPGDRIRPLGCAHSRRLKDVLIDRRVPRPERDRLPLLFVGGHLAWVPGVTIADAFRVGGERKAWIAEIEPV